jgi:hypothetical protein
MHILRTFQHQRSMIQYSNKSNSNALLKTIHLQCIINRNADFTSAVQLSSAEKAGIMLQQKKM